MKFQVKKNDVIGSRIIDLSMKVQGVAKWTIFMLLNALQVKNLKINVLKKAKVLVMKYYCHKTVKQRVP